MSRVASALLTPWPYHAAWAAGVVLWIVTGTPWWLLGFLVAISLMTFVQVHTALRALRERSR
jgi:membrane protein implicated in regulation of membrane protease activity